MIVRNPNDMTKLEFVYMFRLEISEFIKAGCNCVEITNECKIFIRQTVRKMLKYSCRTADVDVFNGLQKNYNKIIPICVA